MTNQSPPTANYLSRIRGIPLLPQEKAARIFSVEEGLLDEPSSVGQLLVATNQRILFFGQNRNYSEASLMPLEELTGVVVTTASQLTFSWLRGILAVAATLVFYLVVAYWLVGHIDSPNIPILNMNFLPFIMLAAIVIGAWVLLRQNVQRAGTRITIHGVSWELSLDCPGENRAAELEEMVQTLFRCREERTRSGNADAQSETSPALASGR